MSVHKTQQFNLSQNGDVRTVFKAKISAVFTFVWNHAGTASPGSVATILQSVKMTENMCSLREHNLNFSLAGVLPDNIQMWIYKQNRGRGILTHRAGVQF